jgi:hypothetical protein
VGRSAFALVVASILAAWALVAWRQVAWTRYAPRTPFLQRAAFDRLDCPPLDPPVFGHPLWVWDTAIREAGWPDVPLHMDGAPVDRTAIDYAVTPHGTIVWIPFLAKGPAPTSGRRLWVGRVVGSVRNDHVPPLVALNMDLYTNQPVFGVMSDAFFAALETHDGTLVKLDMDLGVVAERREAAPRLAGTPAMNYFADDGQGGLFYASYRDDGVMLHHVGSDLRDVVAPRAFSSVRHGPGEHVNPHAAGHAPGRHCFELACFFDGKPNQPCGSTYLAVDDRFEPIATEPVPRPGDPWHVLVRALLWPAGCIAMAAVVWAIARARRWRAIAQSLASDGLEAHVVETQDGGLMLRHAEGVIALEGRHVRRVGAMVPDGPCVVASSSIAARREAYRGSAGIASASAPVIVVAGTREAAIRLVASRRLRAAVAALGTAAVATAVGLAITFSA